MKQVVKKIFYRIIRNNVILALQEETIKTDLLEEQTIKIHLLEEQTFFLLDQLKMVNQWIRYRQLEQGIIDEKQAGQTCSSFDYQWRELPDGYAMPSDQSFMKDIKERVCQMTDYPEEWFSGKNVIDIGCGAGRFSYGLLSLGANVTSVDQSESALRQTGVTCQEFRDRHSFKQINLLEWNETGDYDLAFCFGVTHHTGNTYLAIRNAALKVKPGGRIFLMIYGFPLTLEEFAAKNTYQKMRYEMRHLSFDEKKAALFEKFGEYKGHGWFDAIAPNINDLLTFEEIEGLLQELGFENVHLTVDHHNHHLVADKKAE